MTASALWAAAGLAGGGVVTRAGLALAGAGAGDSRPDLDLATATAATFRPHVGSRFGLGGSAAGRGLTLASVEEHAGDGGLTDSFALTFEDDGPAGLAQAIYRLDHDALGGFGIFLVPGAGGVVAVVNHLLS